MRMSYTNSRTAADIIGEAYWEIGYNLEPGNEENAGIIILF